MILEIERSNFKPKDFKLFHNFLGFPMNLRFKIFSQFTFKVRFFLSKVSFLYLIPWFVISIFIYMQVKFFEFFEKLIPLFIISMISELNQSCDVPLIRLLLLGARLSITAMTFWMTFCQFREVFNSLENLIFSELLYKPQMNDE